MTYRFKDRQGVAGNLRRIARTQLAAAIDHLEGRGAADRDEAVHEARKNVKRVRALLRLFRPVLDGKMCARHNRALRDAGRALSATRDSRVVIDTLQGLRERDPGLAASFERAEEHFLQLHLRQVQEDAAGFEAALTAIAGVRDEVRQWQPRTKGWSAIAPGLLLVYRKAQRAGSRAFSRDPLRSDDLHELRKRVKENWYSLQLLEPCWPELLTVTASELKRLSDLLGDDHDLAVLANAVTVAQDQLGDAELLRAAAEQRSDELRSEARALMGRLYAESPEAYVGRLHSYWRLWRRERRGG